MALARKLLVALWKYVTAGVVIEGAVMKVPDDKHLTKFRNPRDLISPDGSRWTNRSRPWPETPLSRMVLVFLSPARRKRDIGAAVANGDRM